MLKVVFDTVVFVRSLINPHSIWGKLIFQHYHRYQLFVSEPIVSEILEVLHRPELTAKFKTLKKLDMTAIMNILGEASVVEIHPIPQTSRDQKDDKFLATAVAAKADYLVTEDRDLLDMKEYQGVKIITAKTFFDLLSILR